MIRVMGKLQSGPGRVATATLAVLVAASYLGRALQGTLLLFYAGHLPQPPPARPAGRG